MVDATTSPDHAAMRAAGVTAISRYLGPKSLAKVITAGEYSALIEAGFDVILNWENFSFDWLRGTGKNDALMAVGQAISLDYPEGSCIYFSADFDMTWDQWLASGSAYAANVRDVCHSAGFTVGVYGSWDTINWCKGLGFDFFWQSMSTSFSNGENSVKNPWTNLWQQSSGTLGGTSVDYSWIITPYFGQAGTVQPILLVHQVGSNQDWVTNGVLRRHVASADERTNVINYMTVLGCTNLTSVEVSSLDACGADVATLGGTATLTVTQDMLNAAVAANIDATVTSYLDHLASRLAA